MQLNLNLGASTTSFTIMEITKKNKIKESTSKRLNSLPKTYKTYDLDYKKEIIKEVNKYIY